MPNQINEDDSVCLKNWEIEFKKTFKNGLGEINYAAYDNEDNAVDQFEDKTVEIMLFISKTIDQTVEKILSALPEIEKARWGSENQGQYVDFQNGEEYFRDSFLSNLTSAGLLIKDK